MSPCQAVQHQERWAIAGPAAADTQKVGPCRPAATTLKEVGHRPAYPKPRRQAIDRLVPVDAQKVGHRLVGRHQERWALARPATANTQEVGPW